MLGRGSAKRSCGESCREEAGVVIQMREDGWLRDTGQDSGRKEEASGLDSFALLYFFLNYGKNIYNIKLTILTIFMCAV